MIRVLLATDHDGTRRRLRAACQGVERIEVIGDATDQHDTIEKVFALDPDVIVLDGSMPVEDEFAATCELLRRRPDVAMVLLVRTRPIQPAGRLLLNGALVWIPIDASLPELLAAITAATRGRQYPPSCAEVEKRHAHPALPAKLEQLTRRELQVLRQIAMGRTNGEIARKLQISIRTIGSHRSHMLGKLRLRNNADLTRCAIENNLVTETFDNRQPDICR